MVLFLFLKKKNPKKISLFSSHMKKYQLLFTYWKNYFFCFVNAYGYLYRIYSDSSGHSLIYLETFFSITNQLKKLIWCYMLLSFCCYYRGAFYIVKAVWPFVRCPDLLKLYRVSFRHNFIKTLQLESLIKYKTFHYNSLQLSFIVQKRLSIYEVKAVTDDNIRIIKTTPTYPYPLHGTDTS